ncbi:cbb3-type cytochrome c oxidase subunit 3 [Zavarzinia compransoris]|uniref:cbb3-type cytochrome oxidase subunit 3 n=1 Tax=Zavarzinia marina TaxID=2911065 RepID=UPI001F2FD789|nr:cbb3-type cytochrome c oxidase subunit 3 [Zavarzinia marina]MCF4165690.1 cbb3-type cytochrome c oxidase subunit 3 [Zavarzinia marina]
MDFYDTLVWSRILGLAIFFGLFAVFVFWSYRPGGRRYYDDAAQVPFRDESKHAGAEN